MWKKFWTYWWTDRHIRVKQYFPPSYSEWGYKYWIQYVPGILKYFYNTLISNNIDCDAIHQASLKMVGLESSILYNLVDNFLKIMLFLKLPTLWAYIQLREPWRHNWFTLEMTFKPAFNKKYSDHWTSKERDPALHEANKMLHFIYRINYVHLNGVWQISTLICNYSYNITTL